MEILTAKDFNEMILNGYRDLKIHHDEINDLNVFPVPDGDTGTNIASTLTGGVKAIEGTEFDNLGELTAKLARGMLLGARGNSGVIVSQFFAGIAKAFQGLKEANLTQFAAALQSGTNKAYEAVVNPVEGTILTVARRGSEHINRHIDHYNDFESLFTSLLRVMKEALDKTPDLLPVLKEAGVIDSGGAGLVCIIEGMAKFVMGEEVADSVFNGPTNAVSTVGDILFDENSELTYGYCTEFILQLLKAKCDPDSFDLQALIDFLGTIGDSIVAIKSETIVKIHVHTKEPWKAIQYAQQFGEFVTFKMENMSIQHNEVLLKEEVEELEKPREHREVAVVTVSPSKEIGELFTTIIDAVSITGGQTMNPSAEDFLKAFEKANADTIIVFPNNSNVILTAEQAAKMAEGKDIRVIKTKSVIQCYSALSMADFDNGSIDDNIAMFNDVSGSVVDIAIAPAVRDSQLNGVSIKEGHFMGILNHNIVYSGADIIETAVGTVETVEGIKMCEVLTVFYGSDATDPMKADFRRRISEKFPNLEVCEVEGNQPVYPFLIAVE